MSAATYINGTKIFSAQYSDSVRLNERNKQLQLRLEDILLRLDRNYAK